MTTNTWRSIGAVGAGVLTIILVTTLVDIALHAAGVFPAVHQPINDSLALLASSYRLVISIAGAWLTARLAPDRPLHHAMILGYVGTLLGLLGVVTTWNMDVGPRWYAISLAVIAVPQCWFGGWLFERRQRARAAAATA